MTHLLIIALGYVFLLGLSIKTFMNIRFDSHAHVQSHIPAVSFGTSVFGLAFLLYYYATDKQSIDINIILVGVLWTSIINGVISCVIASKQIDDQRGK